MEALFPCPLCRANLRLPSSLGAKAGDIVVCPNCEKDIKVPAIKTLRADKESTETIQQKTPPSCARNDQFFKGSNKIKLLNTSKRYVTGGLEHRDEFCYAILESDYAEYLKTVNYHGYHPQGYVRGPGRGISRGDAEGRIWHYTHSMNCE